MLKTNILSFRLSDLDKQKLQFLTDNTTGNDSTTVRYLIIRYFNELTNNKSFINPLNHEE